MTGTVLRQREPKRTHDHTVAILLNGGRVTATFRAALFDATAREGVSVNEFCLRAAAEKLRAAGSEFSGIFAPGDLKTMECR
ncbi:hypothetical protein [Rhizobium rhizogenes]|uniref:hypothetical protein n=1 Tax=Rhizobium rhizogenes TaxID=359 RepID=UPI0022C5CC64|nr:hypothetical protein [Rhizobium rhizogenes]MCZ7463550.1 hypothetical protein [Rhizobium rhizogenes]